MRLFTTTLKFTSNRFDRNGTRTSFTHQYKLSNYTCCMQGILALFLLNIYLKDTKVFSKLLFILFFGLLFYSVGPGLVEGANYTFWGAVGEKDWLSFRHSGSPKRFFGLFLILPILPMFLSILLFWWRPKGFPKYLVVIFLLT